MPKQSICVHPGTGEILAHNIDYGDAAESVIQAVSSDGTKGVNIETAVPDDFVDAWGGKINYKWDLKKNRLLKKGE